MKWIFEWFIRHTTFSLAALQTTTRANKGKHLIDSDWQQFIIKTYKEGNKGSNAELYIFVLAIAAKTGSNLYSVTQFQPHLLST
ncbi:hypothetical protein H6G64_25160 [Calothrix sp. FACHB-156]|nr:hypothetical protein [Calothrix sp. FACHB-156]